MNTPNLILSRLQRLLCLGLEGTPSDEVFEGTCRVWLDALKHCDGAALGSAFDAVERTATRWPVPAQVIEQMPTPRQNQTQPYTPRLAGPPDEAAQARVRAMIEACAKKLRVPL